MTPIINPIIGLIEFKNNQLCLHEPIIKERIGSIKAIIAKYGEKLV